MSQGYFPLRHAILPHKYVHDGHGVADVDDKNQGRNPRGIPALILESGSRSSLLRATAEGDVERDECLGTIVEVLGLA